MLDTKKPINFHLVKPLKQFIKEEKLTEHQEFQVYIREIEAGCIIKVRIKDGVVANEAFSRLVLNRIKKAIQSDQS